MFIRNLLITSLSVFSICASADPTVLTNEQMDGVNAAGTFAFSFASANGVSTSATSVGRVRSFAGSNARASNLQVGRITVNGGAALSLACCGVSTTEVSGVNSSFNINNFGFSVSLGVLGQASFDN